MTDSWEDDEFEVPTLGKIEPPSNWDDEEDLVEVEKNIITTPSESQLLAQQRKAAEAEQALAAKLKNAELANETAEQKKLREKRQVEEADHEITGELFGVGGSKLRGDDAGSSRGIGAISLKSKQDHTSFGNTIAQKLSDSSAFNTAAFYKSLSKCLQQDTMTTQVLDEILNDIKKIRDAKAKVEKPAAVAVAKKSKKAIKAEEKRHADIFGGCDGVDDHGYEDLEDSFM